MIESDQKVFCNNRNLDQIPEGIPLTTRQLYLQDNLLTSTNELESSLRKLKNLVSIRLYNNRLTRIPKLDSTFLLDLRINQNRFENIPLMTILREFFLIFNVRIWQRLIVNFTEIKTLTLQDQLNGS